MKLLDDFLSETVSFELLKYIFELIGLTFVYMFRKLQTYRVGDMP